MSEWVSPGAARQGLGASGGGIRRAGYTKVAAARLDARDYQPPAWLRKARAGKRRSATRRAGVSRCVCGITREVRPSLVEDYTLLVCGRCSSRGKRPEVPSRPGMIVVRAFNSVGWFGGCVRRIATAGERVSVHRVTALARTASLNAPAEPES
jgi:hypothetical protein